jgi:hypothetical protein
MRDFELAFGKAHFRTTENAFIFNLSASLALGSRNINNNNIKGNYAQMSIYQLHPTIFIVNSENIQTN